MPLDASKYYLLRASNGWSIVLSRGLSPPKITGGGARYNTIERPRRKSVVQWAGDDPWKMDVPVILNGFAAGPAPTFTDKSIEDDVRRINQMTQSRGDLTPPYTFHLDGALPVGAALWVMEGIEWGDNVYWSADARGGGFRVRQDATLHCLQSVTETTLQITKPPVTSTPYRWKAGDTLALVAAKYGHGVSVEQIKTANNIRDAKQIKVGQTIQLPPPIKVG